MNIFKKATACLAAAAVMTSVAVTASAEYQISLTDSDDGEHYLDIIGLPENLEKYRVVLGTMQFSNSDESCDRALAFTLLKSEGEGLTCKVIDTYGTEYEELECVWGSLDGKQAFRVFFPADSELFNKFSQFNGAGFAIGGMALDADGNPSLEYYSSTGESVEQSYVEWSTINRITNDTNNNSGNSATSGYVEPEESEPVSSEPVSEPTSTEPVYEPASSETDSSPSTNVDTGVTGIAAVVGTALLAAGAVIVSRKK